MRYFVLLFAASIAASAQGPQPQRFVPVDPNTTPGIGRLGAAPQYNFVNGKLWNCKQTSGFACTWTQSPSGGGATIQVTANLVKGDNAGNGIAATPGTDYVVPGGNVATASAFNHTPTPCPANQYAISISSVGNLGCLQITYSQIAGTPVVVVDPGGNGFVSRTGLGTSAARTIQGTASDINVSNGDGIAGNPVIDLPNTAITPGACGDSTHFPVPTFDTKGRATGCTTNPLSSGGGSVFTGSAACTSAFSATPTFSLADIAGPKSCVRFEPGAMTANVTAVTFTNIPSGGGAKFSIVWPQDGSGGHTLTHGASATDTCEADISLLASKYTEQFYEVAADGSVHGTSCNSNDPSVPFNTQTDAATITWAIGSIKDAFASVTLGGNRTLNITNPVKGGNYVFVISQGTGSHTLATGTGCLWKVLGGTGSGFFALSTAATAIDVLAFTYDGTNCLATVGLAYAAP